MDTSKIVTGCSLILFSSTLVAGSVNTEEGGPDITLSGGVTAGFHYSTHTSTGDNQNFIVNDALLDISSQPIEIEPIDFNLGVGTLAATKLTETAGSSEKAEFGVQYAKIKYSAFENLLLETGIIDSLIGYEAHTSFNNLFATQGVMKSIQPNYYAGGRGTFNTGDLKLYAEVSQPFAFAVGVNGKVSDYNFEMNYYDEDSGKSIIDLVFAGSMGNFKYAINFDYVLLDVKVANNDDTAMGFGAYAAADIARLTVPLRVEYIKDGTSGIYALKPGTKGFGSGFTFTASPTLNISKSGFVRMEFSMITASNTILKNKSGVGQKSAVSGAFQMGYRF